MYTDSRLLLCFGTCRIYSYPSGLLHSQSAKKLGSTLTKHRSDAKVSDRCLVDVNSRVFAIWGHRSILSEKQPSRIRVNISHISTMTMIQPKLNNTQHNRVHTYGIFRKATASLLIRDKNIKTIFSHIKTIFLGSVINLYQLSPIIDNIKYHIWY